MERKFLQLRRQRRQKQHDWEDLPYPHRVFYILDRGGLPEVDAPFAADEARKWVLRVNVVLTILQALAIVLANEPRFYEGGRNYAVFTINIVCTTIFTVEWVVRLICVPDQRAFLTNILNLIDLFVMIPFWIDLAEVFPEGFSSWLLMLRIARLIRWMLYQEDFDVVTRTVEESINAVTFFVMITIICLPIVGMGVYYAERGEKYPGLVAESYWIRQCDVSEPCSFEESPFQLPSDGMWLAMTTITTLGYGDLIPKSIVGKFLSGLAMVLGVLVLSFPVMILTVNYFQQKEKQQMFLQKANAKRSQQLQGVQREYAKEISMELQAKRKSFAMRESVNLADGRNLISPSTTRIGRSFFFQLEEDTTTVCKGTLVAPTEVRFEPMLILKRNPRTGGVWLDQSRRKKTEFRFTVLLSTPAAVKACEQAVKQWLPPEAPTVTRCKHRHVTQVHYSLEIPEDKGDFLRSLRLLRAVDTQIEANRCQVDGILELYGLSNIDEQHVDEVAAALHRCRMRITAVVAKTQPTYYEVPVFYETLRATNLAQLLRERKDQYGLVYVTATQIRQQIEGVHTIFAVPLENNSDEEVQIVNSDEICRTIGDAVARECCIQLDAFAYDGFEQFLHPALEERESDGSPAKYLGLIPWKVIGKLATRSGKFDAATYGFQQNTRSRLEEDDDSASRMLCTVVVKAVKVAHIHRVEQM